MNIEVTYVRENYEEVMVLTVDEEGSEALCDLFKYLPDHKAVQSVVVFVTTESSRPFRVRFESSKAREDRERKETEEETRLEAARTTKCAAQRTEEKQQKKAEV